MKVILLGANHCEICTDKGDYLQSYQTIVAKRKGREITLYPKWDYSRTTVKHVSQWLESSSKEIRKNIKLGRITVEDAPDL